MLAVSSSISIRQDQIETVLVPGTKWQYQADLFNDALQGSNYNIECLFNEWQQS